jgi:hypothetical protein
MCFSEKRQGSACRYRWLGHCLSEASGSYGTLVMEAL